MVTDVQLMQLMPFHFSTKQPKSHIKERGVHMLRHSLIAVVILLVGALSGCTDRDSGTNPVALPDLSKPAVVLDASLTDTVFNYGGHLNGRQEVPPAATRAQGQVILQLDADTTVLHYKLIVANISNITQAHIHMAPAGTNGSVVAWLYPSGPPPQPIPGRFNGVLARGTITAANLVGPLLGQPLSALVNAMAAGNTYANVHTSQFPGGEIRGQISERVEE